ncbi:MAG: GNAT family N-acetyltransferase [Verrucomicrobiota bacterium]
MSLPPIEFVPARAEDIDSLNRIAQCSKQYWGYGPELMALWADQLAIDSSRIGTDLIEIGIIHSQRIGFYSVDLASCELDGFWLLPDKIGRGFGRQMFRRMEEALRLRGVRDIQIVSDPNADSFYRRMGAKKTGVTESIPKGRYLTVLSYSISP